MMAAPRYAWIGAAAAWLYGYAHLKRYEDEIRVGVDSREYFKRTIHGMQLFAAFCVLYLALSRA